MAQKSKIWVVETADGQHTVEFFERTAFKAAKLVIDGEREQMIVPRMGFEGIDQPILTGGGHDIRIVSTRKKTDLAYDGVYMDSGEQYEPLPKMSTANWVFVIISFCAIFIGGLIPAACAVGGAAAGAAVALNKKLSNKAKLILGIVLMVLTWAAAILVSIFLVKGMRAATNTIKTDFGKDEYSITLTRGFKADTDTDGLVDESAELLFAAMSEDVYAYAQKQTFKKLKLMYGIRWSDAEEYLENLLEIDGSEIKKTESGVSYAVLNEEEYSYVCSCIAKNEAFYYTEMYCTAEDAEKLVPKMIEWTSGVTVAEAGQAENAG